MAAVKKKVEVPGKRAAGKAGAAGKLVGKKPANKKASTATGRKASSRGKRTLEQVMAEYEDARLSDVSDKVFVATSPVHGKGLFAATRLKAGTFISRLHGMPTFDDGTYVLWITDELGLELTNDLKYINHDKNPNAAYSDLDVTIVRDVEAGEELLHDYGW